MPNPTHQRALIETDPFTTPSEEARFGFTAWPASWVHFAGGGDPPFVLAYRCAFAVDEASASKPVRIHVTADERYELFLDGERIGRGPERGAPHHWFFESYDLHLDSGEHVLVARVWSLGEADSLSPAAQMSARPGFLLAAEGPMNDQIGTAVGPWQAKRLRGYRFHSPTNFAVNTPFIGAAEQVDASEFDWGFERGEGEGWSDPAQVSKVETAQSRGLTHGQQTARHMLRPAMLGPMMESPRWAGNVRFAAASARQRAGKNQSEMGGGSSGGRADAPDDKPVRCDDHQSDLAEGLQGVVDAAKPFTVEANTSLRVIFDLEDYVCAYPELTVSGGGKGSSGGAGSEIALFWAEALYEQNQWEHGSKGNRNEIDGKYFLGFGDTYQPDGGDGRTFSPLWWRAGRYVQLTVRTADQPLTIDGFTLRETRYPWQPESAFDSDEPRLARTWPILVRGMQMCMHETYFDCPYYEQLMYAGDTRLEVLSTYALTTDDRLPRKAVAAYDWSRLPTGLTQARYPCRSTQVISPFCLWWICMVHDYALWRGDPGFIAGLMPAVRGIGEYFRQCLNRDGLVEAPDGWNFVDWEPTWTNERSGAPPHAPAGVSGPVNWQAVHALQAKAELEHWVGEPALARRDEAQLRALTGAMDKAFWSESRGMFADDLAHEHWSEHSQCLALLSGTLDEPRFEAVADGLFNAEDLARTTIYFSHYLLETCQATGRIDKLFERLEDWYALDELGLKTTLEKPEPSRSDCHAWGAHPLFHLFASVLGIRPASFGFDELRMRPQLQRSPLNRARATFSHPAGPIEIDLEQTADQTLTGQITLPDPLRGELHANGGMQVLLPGVNSV